MDPTFICLDTETTGVSEEDRLCQLAYIEMDGGGTVCSEVDELFKPPVPIKIEAMAVNHITNAMVEHIPPFQGSSTANTLQFLCDQYDTYLVAHNADYDVEMLRREGLEIPDRVICTEKIIRRLDPKGLEGSKALQYLRYYHDLNDSSAKPHDALGDVKILKNLYLYLQDRAAKAAKIDIADPEQYRKLLNKFVELSAQPKLMHAFPFGKYKGDLIMETRDRRYMRWLLDETDLDPNHKWTIKWYHFPELLQ